VQILPASYLNCGAAACEEYGLGLVRKPVYKPILPAPFIEHHPPPKPDSLIEESGFYESNRQKPLNERNRL